MNAWTWLSMHDSTCIASAAYLAAHDRPWWAVLFFALAMLNTVTQQRKGPPA